MSISPTHAHRSNSSSPSSTLSPNPSPNHGLPQHLVYSGDIHTSRSPQISPATISDAAVSSAADTGGSSKKVTDTRKTNGQKSTRRHFSGNHMQYQSAGRGRMPSQLRNDQVGYPEANGESSGAISSAQNQSTSRTVDFHGGAVYSTVRKNQTMSANHLLNFQYDRISRPQPRLPSRRQQKIRPYNKDLFLQANYRFVVLDSGNYTIESMDADKMLQWENVICVKYSTPYPVQCPICLDTPLCPQITSCGHIFCFPCILRYLLMGAEDHKGDSWKKCPLCFTVISLKDLYTIYIENVNHYQLGDVIQFTLLTRQKDSMIPSQKNQHGIGSTGFNNVDLGDNFSKFCLTSDVDLSVGEAYSELRDWLARAELGLVDDLQLLPYVCASLEQLEQRKKFWTEMRSLTTSPPLGNSPPHSNINVIDHSFKSESHVPDSSRADDFFDSELYASPCARPFADRNKLESKNLEKLDEEEHVVESVELLETCEGEEKLSSSYEEENSLERHSNDSAPTKERDSYCFYQVVDGQYLILHPLNMKCLLHHYGSYDQLPSRISGKLLQLETVTQTEAMRRRYRYLSHFSLTTTFQLCEIETSEVLPFDALLPFMDEIKKRGNQRKRLAKKEREDKAKSEAALIMQEVPIPSSFGYSFINKSFSLDDFEALGSAPSSSTPPPNSDRKRFSDVTRFGFAAAHDSPSLKVEKSNNAAEERAENPSLAGPSNAVTLSFANIISTAKTPEIRETPLVGKKGKKPSRVLLSTAGGRRY